MQYKPQVKAGLTFLFGILALLYWFIRDPAVIPALDSLAYFAASIPALIASFYVSRVYGWKNAHGKTFLVLSAGMLMFMLGNALAFFNQATTMGVLATFPYVLYTLGYLVVFLGLGAEVLLHGFSPRKFDIPFFVGTLVFLLLIGGTILFTSLRAYDPAVPLSVNLAATIYPILDLIVAVFIVLIVQIVREYQGGALFYSWLALFFSIGLFLLGDIFFSTLSAWKIPVIWPFTFVNLLWAGGFLTAAYGCFSIGSSIQDVQSLMRHRKSRTA